MATDLTNEQGALDVDAANKLLDEALEADRAGDDEPTKTPDGDDRAAVDAEASADEDDDSDGDGQDADDWRLSPEVAEIVEAMGLSQEQLVKFADRGEFDNAADLLTAMFMKEGARVQQQEPQDRALEAIEKGEKKEAQRQRAAEQPRDEQNRFKKESDDEAYKPALDPNLFDEEVVKEFDRLHQFHEKRYKSLETEVRRMVEKERAVEHRAVIAEFDNLVDGLGHEDLFGKSGELNRGTPAFEARNRLFGATVLLLEGLAARGRSAGLTKAIVSRALGQEFAKDLETKARRSVTDKVRSQSRQRLGTGRERKSETRSNDDDHSDLFRAYAKLQRGEKVTPQG